MPRNVRLGHYGEDCRRWKCLKFNVLKRFLENCILGININFYNNDINRWIYKTRMSLYYPPTSTVPSYKVMHNPPCTAAPPGSLLGHQLQPKGGNFSSVKTYCCLFSTCFNFPRQLILPPRESFRPLCKSSF